MLPIHIHFQLNLALQFKFDFSYDLHSWLKANLVLESKTSYVKCAAYCHFNEPMLDLP